MRKLIDDIKRFRDERGWKQFHNPKDLAISVSVEAAELLELFQWREQNRPADMELTALAKGELADVFIYLLLLADSLDIDLLEAAQQKLLQNDDRFPVDSSFGVAKKKRNTK